MFLDQTGRTPESPGSTELGSGAAQYVDLSKPDAGPEQTDPNKMKSDLGAFEVEGFDVDAARARALETQYFIPEDYKRRIYDLGAQFATWEENGVATYHTQVHIAAARWLESVIGEPGGGEMPPGKAEYFLAKAEDILIGVKTGTNTAGAPFRFERGKLVMVTPDGQKTVSESGTETDIKRGPDPETDRIIALIEERKAMRRQADAFRVEALQLAQGAGVMDAFPKLKLWLPYARGKGLVGDIGASELPKPEGSLDSIKEKITAFEQQADKLEADANALTRQIMADTPRFPPNPS